MFSPSTFRICGTSDSEGCLKTKPKLTRFSYCLKRNLVLTKLQPSGAVLDSFLVSILFDNCWTLIRIDGVKANILDTSGTLTPYISYDFHLLHSHKWGRAKWSNSTSRGAVTIGPFDLKFSIIGTFAHFFWFLFKPRSLSLLWCQSYSGLQTGLTSGEAVWPWLGQNFRSFGQFAAKLQHPSLLSLITLPSPFKLHTMYSSFLQVNK